ncbi:MAG: hypothetical protein AAGI69_09175 [Cyanobacteria bacterium P01_H01_bin.21]
MPKDRYLSIGIANPQDDFSGEIPWNSNGSGAVHLLNQQSL